MADRDNDGYDDATGQQNPVINAQPANTLPRGAVGSITNNPGTIVSPSVNIDNADRTPGQRAAWIKANQSAYDAPVTQGVINKIASAGGKAGALSKYGTSDDPMMQRGLGRYYGTQLFAASTPPRATGDQLRAVTTQKYSPFAWNSGVAGDPRKDGPAGTGNTNAAGSNTMSGKVPTTIGASPETVRENKNANRYASTSRYSTETLRENYSPLQRSFATAPVDRGINRPSFTGPSVQTPARASIVSPVKPPSIAAAAPRMTGRGN